MGENNRRNSKVVLFDKKDDMDLEEIELELIDAGLEEIEEEQVEIDDTQGETKTVVTIYGSFESFGTLSHAIEDMGISITKAELQRIPNSPLEFTEEQMQEAELLIDKLEDDEDVQAVYTNIE